jgi:hypothetical protein
MANSLVVRPFLRMMWRTAWQGTTRIPPQMTDFLVVRDDLQLMWCGI